MAYTTIKKPSDYFNTKLYTGNGTTNAITGVGFQPDLVWMKKRDSSASHNWEDAVRGAGKYIRSDTTDAEVDASGTFGITSFDSDGFSLTGSGGRTNASGGTYASWNWLASNTTASNTDGSITSTVSANTTSGFSIGTCAGLATNNDTLGHGLGAVPKMIMVKNTASTGNWFVYHYKLPTGSVGQGSYLNLNENYSYSDGSIWNNTAPTSSVFTIKGGDFATGESLVFYAFAEKKGFSKFGSYVGTNGGANGPFIYTGFKPAFILIKNVSAAADWNIRDNKRDTYNAATHFLVPNSNSSEVTLGEAIDILSNGFKIKANGLKVQDSGNTYIYMAFAENPLVGTNNIPATAR